MDLSKIIDGLIRFKMPPLNQKLNAAMISELSHASHAWVTDLPTFKMDQPGIMRVLSEFLSHFITASEKEIRRLKNIYGEFNRRFTDAASEKERQEHILSFAQQLGATEKELQLDQKAFGRWFGQDTVTQRYQKKVNWLERKIAFALERLSAMAIELLALSHSAENCQRTFKQLPIEKVVMPLLNYDGDSRVRIEAFKCLSETLKIIPRKLIKESMDESMVKFVFRAALDRKQQIWIQCEALNLLEKISVKAMGDAIYHRLTKPLKGDDIFVRAKAVALLCSHLEKLPQSKALLKKSLKDPSPFVRQHLSKAIKNSVNEEQSSYLGYLATKDPSPEVRGMALLEIEDFIKKGRLKEEMLKILLETLHHETDDFVKRVGILMVQKGLLASIQKGERAFSEKWFNLTASALTTFNQTADNVAIRRWAKRSTEIMWSHIDVKAKELKACLAPIVKTLKVGKEKKIPVSYLKTFGEETFGRVISVLSQNDFPISAHVGPLGITLSKGHRFKFRFWRFMHEFLRPSPDKRQAFSHTIGRHFKGSFQFPSAILAELTPTKVPGEPLFIPEESGWRPYLPLVDEMISYASPFSLFKREKKIFTSEGITSVSSPKTLGQRILSQIHLTKDFVRFADLRNWDSGSQGLPCAYIQALEKLGFKISFQPYLFKEKEKVSDRSVLRFFPSER